MRWWVIVAVGLAAAVVAWGPARVAAKTESDCMQDPLGPPGWTIVTFGDLTLSNTDSEGRLAVGRDATLTSYGVASSLPTDPARVDLATGRDLTANNSGLNHGSATYVRTFSGNLTAPNGTITRAAPPFDFDALFQGLAIRSSAWAELDADGTVGDRQDDGSRLFSGTNAVRNVFRVSATTLADTGEIRIRVPFGSTTLINVTGTSYSALGTYAISYWNGSAYVQLGSPESNPDLEALRRATLWNFPDAKDVTLGGSTAWQGAVLAPQAVVHLGYQQVNGEILAGALYGNGALHIHPPSPCLPDPEPCPPNPPIPTPTPTPTVSPTPTPTPEPTVTPTPTPAPSPTPTPTATPTPRPTVTPEPTVDPISPTPTPEPTTDPGQPLDPGEGSGAVLGANVDVKICKKVMTHDGRAVEHVTRRAGRLARFRVRVTNLGTDVARNVRVCDDLPAGMTIVKAPRQVVYRNGRPCVTLPQLVGQRQAFFTVRIARTARGHLINIAEVHSRDSGTRRNAAHVHVLPARAAGGGVTG